MIESTKFSRSRNNPTITKTLVDGTYAREEAYELALRQVDAIVGAHKLRNLGSQIRRQTDNSDATSSIESLQVIREELRAKLAEAQMTGKRVVLKSTIELTLEDDSFAR